MPFRYRLMFWLGGCAVLLSGCATDAVGELSSHALGAFGASAAAGVAGSAEAGLSRLVPEDATLDLATVGVPLARLAEGHVEGPRPPDLVGDTLKDAARQHGPGVAASMALGAVTGGLGMAVGGPSPLSMARTAYSVGRNVKDAAEEQRLIEEAYARSEEYRAATALVPDTDRPEEAKALLELADQPAGSAAEWRNPATGASGRIEVGPLAMSDDARCRPVQREYRQGEVQRKGQGLICRQNGVWYDLS